MSKIINLINNDIFQIKIIKTIECNDDFFTIKNLNPSIQSASKVYVSVNNSKEKSNKTKKIKNKVFFILPLFLGDLKKKLHPNKKVNITNAMYYHNNGQLPIIPYDSKKNSMTEKEKIKYVKKMSRKLYGIRKTKIHQIILYNEMYILIMKDMNNKDVDISRNIYPKNIFNWEKYNLHKSKYILLDNVIKSIYNHWKQC